MWNTKYIDDLNARRARAKAGGGEKRVAAQHGKGKLTVWECIEYLFDPGSFQEVGLLVESRFTDFGMEEKKLPGDGVVIGFGTINGVPVYVAAEDFTVMGGTYGEYHSRKIVRIMDMAFQSKASFIIINDSGGARMEEGTAGLNGYAEKDYLRMMYNIPEENLKYFPLGGIIINEEKRSLIGSWL